MEGGIRNVEMPQVRPHFLETGTESLLRESPGYH